jgi:hypothetical protein
VKYHLPGSWVMNRIHSDLLPEWNKPLADAGVKVGVLFATNTDDGPALKHGGHGAAALVSIVPLVQRMYVTHDALIRIDSVIWGQLDDRSQEALLVHELLHLELQRQPDTWTPSSADEPWWRLDDLGRPMLKLIEADYYLGDGFAAVIAKYGASSLEWKNLTVVHAIAQRAYTGEIPERRMA